VGNIFDYPADEQKTFSQLRAQYRAEAQRQLRERLHPAVVWKQVTGVRGSVNPKDYVMVEVPLLTDTDCSFEGYLKRRNQPLDIPLNPDGTVPIVRQSFGLDNPVPEFVGLFEQARRSEEFEDLHSMIQLPYGVGVDRDAPALCALDDETVLNWTEAVLKEEK
jgi:hypothetical protein